MGFVIKSAMGLGLVYGAMFGPSLRSSDVAPQASLCAAVARAGLKGDVTLQAQLQAAGCAAAVVASVQKLSSPPVAAPVLARPEMGTLTQADMEEPWFGPAHNMRKRAKG